MGELTKEEMAHLDELRRNIAEQYTNGKWVLDATSWLPVIDRLVAKVERLEAETVEARSVVASMREHVLEATIAPNLKMFSAIKDGKVYALPPDKVRGFFEEIDARWKSPLVQKWSEEFRRARAVADSAQYEIPRLRARNEALEQVAKHVAEWARGRARLEDEADEQGGEEHHAIARKLDAALENTDA